MPGKTVLVIDTDIDTEQQIMSTLEAAGYLVFAAQTDDVLSENALKVSPSLLFFSAPASGAKGLETCRMIHQNKAFTGIPIIVLTPFAEPMDPQYTALYGIVDILRIPFAAPDLLRMTEAALSGESSERTEEPVDAAPAPAAGGKGKAVPPVSEAPAAAQKKPKVKVTVTPPPVVEDIPLKEVFGDIEGKDQPNFPPPPVKKKGSRVLVLALILVLVALAGGAAFYFKDLLFPPSRPAVVAKAPQPAPKPEVPAAQPAPATVQPQAAKPAPAPSVEQKPQSAAKTPAPAAPAARPAAAPSTSPQGKTGFSVQLGAFKDGAHAEALAKKFKAKGYDAFVKKTESKDKGTLHRVLVGKFADRKESQKMAESLRAKEKVQAVNYSD